MHGDARLHLLRVGLLLTDFAGDLGLLTDLVLGLEVNLVLEVALERPTEESISL